MALLLLTPAAPAAWGFANAAVGAKITDAVLPGVDGGQHHLLTAASANVFLFLKPGQDNSDATLRQFAQLEKEFAGKPVHWVALVSDQVKPSVIQASRQAAGATMPMLFDVGDELFGRLGVTLIPCTGIVDAEGRLVAYQPFARVNYVTMVRAKVRHLLQEIDAAELARISDPPPTVGSDDHTAAHLRLRLAEKLFRSKMYVQALANVKVSVEREPANVGAHTLMGRILAAQNLRAEAGAAFDRALALDPSDPAARQGKAELEPRRPPP